MGLSIDEHVLDTLLVENLMKAVKELFECKIFEAQKDYSLSPVKMFAFCYFCSFI